MAQQKGERRGCRHTAGCDRATAVFLAHTPASHKALLDDVIFVPSQPQMRTGTNRVEDAGRRVSARCN